MECDQVFIRFFQEMKINNQAALRDFGCERRLASRENRGGVLLLRSRKQAGSSDKGHFRGIPLYAGLQTRQKRTVAKMVGCT